MSDNLVFENLMIFFTRMGILLCARRFSTLTVCQLANTI
jgi:hypothetical protein